MIWLHPLISGIIVTFEPLGREGKAACIEAFTSHFEHKCACLIDDNADILEEVSQNPKALGVHIKLSKKRRLRSDVNFDWGTWLSDDWVFAAVSKFLDQRCAHSKKRADAVVEPSFFAHELFNAFLHGKAPKKRQSLIHTMDIVCTSIRVQASRMAFAQRWACWIG